MKDLLLRLKRFLALDVSVRPVSPPSPPISKEPEGWILESRAHCPHCNKEVPYLNMVSTLKFYPGKEFNDGQDSLD